jgi:D,D-heptose 1,7-bisphosphate phosphatase
MNFKDTDVLILAGGRGTRIKSITNKIPKTLIQFNKRPILDLLLFHISKYNFNRIFILTSYMSKKIFKKYHNKFYNFIKIICHKENKRLGTWGAIYNIRKKIKKNFIIINGDTLFNCELQNFLKFKLVNEDLVMFVSNNHFYKKNNKLVNLKLTKKKNIVISEKSKFINSGYYYSSYKIFNKNYKDKTSIENEVIPDLIKKKKIKGIIENKKIIDIGTRENLVYAKKNIPKMLLKPAIFFDRDGVINYDFGHVYKFKDFKFKPGVIRTLKFLSKKNIYIFIVTNQAGIAKGLYKKKDFYILHKKIKNYLLNQKIFINDIKFSPFHANAIVKKYKKKSNFRKPGNLMIEELFSKWYIIRNRSFMIGDSISDKIAAKKSKLYFEFPQRNIYNQVKNICKKYKIK